jgi:hypothetical protein
MIENKQVPREKKSLRDFSVLLVSMFILENQKLKLLTLLNTL